MLKFLNTVLLIVITVFILLIVRVYLFKTPFWQSKISNTNLEMIESNVKQMDLFFKSAQQTPQQIANLLEIKDISIDEMRIIMKSALINEEIFGTCIAFEPGIATVNRQFHAPYMYKNNDSTIFKDLNDNGYQYFYQDWYLIPKILQKPCWSEPYYDDGVDSLMITYSVPFFSFNGRKNEFAGIVTIDISLNWLFKFFNDTFKKNPYNGYSIMISENGTVISAPKKEWIYNQTIYSLAAEENMDILREIGRDIKNGKKGKKLFVNREQNKSYYYYYSVIPSCSWGIIYVLSKDM